MTGWSKPVEAIGSKPAIKALRPHGLISNAWRWGAGVISAGAGLVSILSYTHSLKSKLEGLDSLSTEALAHASVRWVGVSPTVDTATSIGDTIQLAVTATDGRGNALLGAPTVWSSTDSAVASVDSAGTVVARGGGTTAITVTIGGKSARAHVYVQQRPAELSIIGRQPVPDARGRPAQGPGSSGRLPGPRDPQLRAQVALG